MNCHRDITSKMVADFPAASIELLNQRLDHNNLYDRLNGNHGIFTEMDHGFVNPVSEKFKDLIAEKFNVNKWDAQSGYVGTDVFNEYMTWAVWDVFVKRNFPEIADSVSCQWQYQNASRGFFAQNIFSDKLLELTNNQNLESAYLPLLKWCKQQEQNLSVPTIIGFSNTYDEETKKTAITVNFSEQMKQSESFGTILSVMENGYETGINKNIEITDTKWTNGGKTVTFNIESEYRNFLLLFNWWGIGKPLVSKNGIFLQNKSYIIIQERQTTRTTPSPSKRGIFIAIGLSILCIIAGCVYWFLKK
ncbi:hypothetical protein FACS1894180_9430 [Bacteroidia bacterium]|nr:hypothetical protein FACS1894180_9430 [Bacteroidia bacterium]